MKTFFDDVRSAFKHKEPEYKAKLVLELRLPDSTEVEAHDYSSLEIISAPGIPDKPDLVDPKTLPKRRLGSTEGRRVMIHAIAHIEFSAINLALDAIQRFPTMPLEYHQDWLSVAQDEAKHFLMLNDRLKELESEYGEFSAHDGLWHMAEVTKHAVLDRMAIVPRMMEARGLDMNPLIMKRFEAVGDAETVRLLQIILDDEINHVSIGNKWFHYCCGMEHQSPNEIFKIKYQQYFQTSPKGALNIEARLKAGFTYDELDFLNEMASKF